MSGDDPIHRQIAANLPALDAMPQFAGDQMWLTFYLSGQAQALRSISDALAGAGWCSLDDWESGFLYPKVRVERMESAIMDVVRTARDLCERHRVEILEIDADTSPDIMRSEFVTLFSS